MLFKKVEKPKVKITDLLFDASPGRFARFWKSIEVSALKMTALKIKHKKLSTPVP
jgi:hypothetical protein